MCHNHLPSLKNFYSSSGKKDCFISRKSGNVNKMLVSRLRLSLINNVINFVNLKSYYYCATLGEKKKKKVLMEDLVQLRFENLLLPEIKFEPIILRI